MKIKNLGKLVSAIVICQLAGVIGSIFTNTSVQTWYTELKKPSFAPPGWFIGTVWITLYTLMGISLYLIWNKGLRNKRIKEAISIFFVQLVLNSIWSILFFGLQSPFFALIEIIILWIAILFTILKFYRISKNAGLLLIPYIVWVSVALVLNFSIWWLNP